jgi:glucose-6-phosphate isomerase
MQQQIELWERFNRYTRRYPGLGLLVDFSRMSFDEEFLKSIEGKVKDAFKAMEALEGGAIANPDENRMVGHYWLRSPELAPTAELREEIVSTLKRVTEFVAEVKDFRSSAGKEFRSLLIVGIGGSALGPQLLSDALGDLYRSKTSLKFHSLDNTDPDGIARTLGGLNLAETLVLVVSKSGGTVETRNGMLETKAAFERAGIEFSRSAVAITLGGSALASVAESEKWLAILPMQEWIGGRTSLFSSVGLLPAALEGIPILELLEGAKEMDRLTRVAEPLQNPAAILAQMWYFAGEGRGKKDMVILPYKDRLTLFSKYLQQLVMESLGKEFDLDGKTVNQGIAVYGNKGSTDQHAYVQQLRDGVNNFFVTFIEVLSDGRHGLEVKENVTTGDYLNGFLQGTRAALYEKGRDSITLTLDELTPRSLGALIALYERAVGLYASLVNINAYHQPGVEAGKKAAERVVELQQLILQKGLTESYTAEEVAAAIGAPLEVETVYKTLCHLSKNGRGVEMVPGNSPKNDRFSFRA